MYFSGAQRPERVKEVVLLTSMLRGVVKKTGCDDRTIATKLKVEEVSVLSAVVHADIRVC